MIRKKKYKGMFVAASIFGFISAFINFVYIGMFKEVESSSYITILIVLSVIAIISGSGFLIVALMKNKKTLILLGLLIIILDQITKILLIQTGKLCILTMNFQKQKLMIYLIKRKFKAK